MDITDRLDEVRARIITAAGRAGRYPEEIELVAVTKTWPATTVAQAYHAGLRHFGENRAEELATKKAEVDSLLGLDVGITWHAIGALQSRKTGLVVENAAVFHALDRPKIAHRLSNQLVENGLDQDKPLIVFIEVNVSGESSKAGIDCTQWEKDGNQRENLAILAQLVNELPGLHSAGLMTMAPWQVSETTIRSVFQRTRLLAQWLQDQYQDATWSQLSMGMTDDFEIAIEEGATHIRVGRAIFGSRL